MAARKQSPNENEWTWLYSRNLIYKNKKAAGFCLGQSLQIPTKSMIKAGKGSNLWSRKNTLGKVKEKVHVVIIFFLGVVQENLHRDWPKGGISGSLAGKESACNAGDPSSIPGPERSPGEGIGYWLQYSWISLVAQMVKNLPAMWETWVRSLGWEDSLEEDMAAHSSTLAWRIPWTEEPDGLPSMESELQRVWRDWVTKHNTDLRAWDFVRWGR